MLQFKYKLILLLVHAAIILSFVSCSVQKQLSKAAKKNVLEAPTLKAAHVGISIYEPATNKYWFDHQGDKYFVPASNTKIPTCYIAMKYLGDSLVGLKYAVEARDGDTGIIIKPAGDPSFLHPDFKTHPAYNFLKTAGSKILWKNVAQEFSSLAPGWSWNDYQETYMVERSVFPIYGNVVKIIQKDFGYYAVPKYFNKNLSLGNGYMRPIQRLIGDNSFYFDTIPANRQFTVPFITRNIAGELVQDTVKAPFFKVIASDNTYGDNLDYKPIHSQPTDSLLKPLMHRSDNFFAEQCLLMVSNKILGVMNDRKIIDTILKTDFKDLPQKPSWADGSGLSRYNLFTPQSLVAILNKIKNEFGMDRIKEVFPTGGEGTIRAYYKADSTYIYAKTGTLSGVVALSGYLITKKNKLLIFSVLVNNHRGEVPDIRKAVEKFIQNIRNDY